MKGASPGGGQVTRYRLGTLSERNSRRTFQPSQQGRPCCAPCRQEFFFTAAAVMLATIRAARQDMCLRRAAFRAGESPRVVLASDCGSLSLTHHPLFCRGQ